MLGMMDKAWIILDKLNSRPAGKEAVDAIYEALEEIEEMEPTRTLEQIQQIVDAACAGIPVQIDYAAAEEDGEYIVRPCWQGRDRNG